MVPLFFLQVLRKEAKAEDIVLHTRQKGKYCGSKLLNANKSIDKTILDEYNMIETEVHRYG